MTGKTLPIPNAVGDCLLDRRGVASILGMTAAAISVAMCRGIFPIKPVRIGSRIRFRASDVRQFIERGGTEATR